MATFEFQDLDQVIDQVHALFDEWAEGGEFKDALDPEGLDVLRLAVHEWLANLVQHARFEGTPSIMLHVEMDADVVHCSIDDSSHGFDFAGQLETQKAVLDAPAPSERGRGLLMLVTCTEELDFRPRSGDVPQHIEFSVRRSTASFLSALFRPEDLEDDFELAKEMGLLPDEPLGDLTGEAFNFIGDGALGAPDPVIPPATNSK